MTALEAANAAMGGISALINNAGIAAQGGDLEELEFAEWKRVMSDQCRLGVPRRQARHPISAREPAGLDREHLLDRRPHRQPQHARLQRLESGGVAAVQEHRALLRQEGLGHPLQLDPPHLHRHAHPRSAFARRCSARTKPKPNWAGRCRSGASASPRTSAAAALYLISDESRFVTGVGDQGRWRHLSHVTCAWREALHNIEHHESVSRPRSQPSLAACRAAASRAAPDSACGGSRRGRARLRATPCPTGCSWRASAIARATPRPTERCPWAKCISTSAPSPARRRHGRYLDSGAPRRGRSCSSTKPTTTETASASRWSGCTIASTARTRNSSWSSARSWGRGDAVVARDEPRADLSRAGAGQRHRHYPCRSPAAALSSAARCW